MTGCVIISEPKLQYPLSSQALFKANWKALYNVSSLKFDDSTEWVEVIPREECCDLTIVCSGILLPQAISAAATCFFESEITTNILCPNKLHPLAIPEEIF